MIRQVRKYLIQNKVLMEDRETKNKKDTENKQ